MSTEQNLNTAVNGGSELNDGLDVEQPMSINNMTPLYKVGDQVKWSSKKYDQNMTGIILDVHILEKHGFIEYLVEWAEGTGWQPEVNIKAV